MVKKSLPTIGKIPVMMLSADIASQVPIEMLSTLRNQFFVGSERLVQRWVFWIHLLVESNNVGLVEWKNQNVCCYHFFSHNHSKKLHSRKNTEKTKGGITTGTQTDVVEYTLFNNRHVHHLVDAKNEELKSFKHQIPDVISDLLKDLPSWISDKLRIVSGNLTCQEKFVKKTDSEITIESTVLYEFDPAITLDIFAFVGWQTVQETQTYVPKSIEDTKRRKRQFVSTIMWTALGAVVLAGIAFLIFWSIENTNQKEMTTYKKYVAMATSHGSKQKSGYMEKIIFAPGSKAQNVEFYYGGIVKTNVYNSYNLILKGKDSTLITNPQVFSFRSEEAYDVPYGDVDFKYLGIPVTLHIISATDSTLVYVPVEQ